MPLRSGYSRRRGRLSKADALARAEAFASLGWLTANTLQVFSNHITRKGAEFGARYSGRAFGA